MPISFQMGIIAVSDMDTTYDGLLNRQLWVKQPKKGFRIAVDTVLLAAAVPAKAGDRVLDMGCGVGGAMLCLGFRVSGPRLTGIDIQPELVALCQENIIGNKMSERANATALSVLDIPKSWDVSFDHVMMNPPYYDKETHDVSPNAIKATANTHDSGDLQDWIAAAHRVLNDSGTLTMIHTADQRDLLIKLLSPSFSQLIILPIVSKSGQPNTRVIIRATKIGQGVSEIPEFVMHKSDGAYTDAADGILRNAAPLFFT